MIEYINDVVLAVVCFILGLIFHSKLLHYQKRYGWTFPWDHNEDPET